MVAMMVGSKAASKVVMSAGRKVVVKVEWWDLSALLWLAHNA